MTVRLRLFLAQFRAFWQLRARLGDAALTVRRVSFRFRTRAGEEADSSSAIRHIARLTLVDFTVAFVLSAAVWWANPRVTVLPSVDSATYIQLASGIAQIGGVFIGLYYAAITAAMTAVYAQMPCTVSHLEEQYAKLRGARSSAGCRRGIETSNKRTGWRTLGGEFGNWVMATDWTPRQFELLAITMMFRDVADKDYIAARLLFRHDLELQFLWSALQAVEKYLKAILLYNGRNARGLGHSLTRAFDRVCSIDDVPFQFPTELRAFLQHLENFGQNRYLVMPHYVRGDELLQLDRAVWHIRRYCRSGSPNTVIARHLARSPATERPAHRQICLERCVDQYRSLRPSVQKRGKPMIGDPSIERPWRGNYRRTALVKQLPREADGRVRCRMAVDAPAAT
jgi:hypothetical protein